MATSDSMKAVPCTNTLDSYRPMPSLKRVFMTPCTLMAAPAMMLNSIPHIWFTSWAVCPGRESTIPCSPHQAHPGRPLLACLDVAFALLIESGVEGVVVPGVEVFLHGAQGVAEALEVHDFAFAEEANDVFDVGVVDQAQDVVVGQAGLLFGRQVLVQVGQGIASRLQGAVEKG